MNTFTWVLNILWRIIYIAASATVLLLSITITVIKISYMNVIFLVEDVYMFKARATHGQSERLGWKMRRDTFTSFSTPNRRIDSTGEGDESASRHRGV